MVRRKLRDLGTRRTEAETVVRETAEQLAPLVVEAHELGIPITEIAKDSGLSRPTIYDILRRTGT